MANKIPLPQKYQEYYRQQSDYNEDLKGIWAQNYEISMQRNLSQQHILAKHYLEPFNSEQQEQQNNSLFLQYKKQIAFNFDLPTSKDHNLLKIQKVNIEQLFQEKILTNLSTNSEKSTFSANQITEELSNIQIYSSINEESDQQESYRKTKTVKKGKRKAIRISQTDRHRQKFQSSRTTVHKKALKKDESKNVPGNSFKYIVNKFNSQRYSRQFNKLCKKHLIEDPQKLRELYSKDVKCYIGLNDLPHLLNYKSGEVQECKLKKAFYEFYVWFLRKRYTLHILQQSQIEHKDTYLQIKNKLLYLPQYNEKMKKQQTFAKYQRTVSN